MKQNPTKLASINTIYLLGGDLAVGDVNHDSGCLPLNVSWLIASIGSTSGGLLRRKLSWEAKVAS